MTALRLLRGVRVVQVDQRLAVDGLRENRKIFADSPDVVSHSHPSGCGERYPQIRRFSRYGDHHNG